MASFAIDACPQMGLMAEVDEVGLLVYAVPRYWLISLPVARQGLNGFVVGGDDGVAAHAFLHGGYTSHVCAHGAGMAKQTLHAGLNVGPVAVGDGLIGRSQDLRAGENYTAEDNG